MTAYFHRPDELVSELSAAGFRVQELTGIEGPAWLARDFDCLWADPRERERLLQCTRGVEREPALLDASSHIMAIGEKIELASRLVSEKTQIERLLITSTFPLPDCTY
jgi:hypothetical protein